jgi:hypothetical protein
VQVHPAGVAYTNPGMGYQTVNLGFGIEYMMGPSEEPGHWASGLPDRADLLANIMEYFGKSPAGPGTSVPHGGFANALGQAFPNPFNPVTTLEYSTAAPGLVTLRIYDAAGRVVKTLLDGAVEPGEHRTAWDGTTNTGDRAASGVYFVRMEIDGNEPFSATKKLVMLK